MICRNSETHPEELTLDKDYLNISKFLNRILGLPVDLQNRLFHYFSDTMAATIAEAMKCDSYEFGVKSLVLSKETVDEENVFSYDVAHPTGLARIDLHTFNVVRGKTWESAAEKCSRLVGQQEGFYITRTNVWTKSNL